MKFIIHNISRTTTQSVRKTTKQKNGSLKTDSVSQMGRAKQPTYNKKRCSITVKKCEQSESVPICKLVSQPDSFTDADKRHRTPGSETKDYHSQHNHVSIMFVPFSLESHRSYAEEPRQILPTVYHTQESYAQGIPVFYNELQANLPKFCPREHTTFILLDSKQNHPVLWQETVLLLSKTVHYTNILEKIVWSKSFHDLCSPKVQKHRSPWGIVSQQ